MEGSGRGAGIRNPQVYLGHTQLESQCMDKHRSPCPVGSQPSPSDRAEPAYFPDICALRAHKCLEQTGFHNLMSIHVIQMNRGNKVFSVYRVTSGLTATVMSSTGFNSTEALLCDSIFCSLITNSRNTDLNISV